MRKLQTLISFLLVCGVYSSVAQAGVFTMPRFVEPNEYTIGLEPELTFSDGAGIGVNAKFTHGYSDLVNFMGMIGTGSGPRNFRVGGAAVFDFFPDVDDQPGIGVATQGIYYRRRDVGRLELTGIPYIHKAFKTGNSLVEPFAAFPIGIGFRSDNYDGLFSVVVGTMFHKSDHVSFVIELGVNVEHSDTYIAGGVSFSH